MVLMNQYDSPNQFDTQYQAGLTLKNDKDMICINYKDDNKIEELNFHSNEKFRTKRKIDERNPLVRWNAPILEAFPRTSGSADPFVLGSLKNKRIPYCSLIGLKIELRN